MFNVHVEHKKREREIMILDNKNNEKRVYEWLNEYTETGKMDIVTGYFTVGALSLFISLKVPTPFRTKCTGCFGVKYPLLIINSTF